MSKQTIRITGTDVNVGEVIESLMTNDTIGTETKEFRYSFEGVNLYGIENNAYPRLTSADVVIETMTTLEQRDLDAMRDQFNAIDLELVEND